MSILDELMKNSGELISGWIKMDEQYIGYIPRILSAYIAPNPASINNSILISVSAEDEAVILEASWFQSNEIYTGEA